MATAVKKASQSSQSAWAGSGEVVTEVTRWAAVSSGVEEGLVVVRRVWMGVEKGFGGLVPGMSRIGVIVEWKVEGSWRWKEAKDGEFFVVLTLECLYFGF